MSYPIAEPRRTLTTADQRRLAPRPLGGANGNIATPSRLAALDGSGVVARPGPRVPLDGALGSQNLYGNPVLTWTDWPQRLRNGTPRGYAATRYVRMFIENIVPVLRFAPPQQGRTNTTLNGRTGGDGPPLSPIPHNRRFVMQTFRQMYDTRVQTLYSPHVQSQIPLAGRRYLKGSGAVMAKPYFPRLTRLAATTSYGQQTQTLQPNPQGVLSRYSVGV